MKGFSLKLPFEPTAKYLPLYTENHSISTIIPRDLNYLNNPSPELSGTCIYKWAGIGPPLIYMTRKKNDSLDLVVFVSAKT